MLKERIMDSLYALGTNTVNYKANNIYFCLDTK